MAIIHGLVGPKAMEKSVVDGKQINISARLVVCDGVTEEKRVCALMVWRRWSKSGVFGKSGTGNFSNSCITSLSTSKCYLVVFLAFFIIWRILQLIMRRTLRDSTLDQTTYSFVETAAKYIVLTIGIVSALDAVGINTGALLASLGIVGVTIGFAARDSLSNFISGIIIFIDRPFVLGDLVEIEDKYGRVSEITLRSTRVVTSDGRMLAAK